MYFNYFVLFRNISHEITGIQARNGDKNIAKALWIAGSVAPFFKEDFMKKTLLWAVPCLFLGIGVFFVVNHAARARLIVAAAGELPNIPGCPLHESCVKALQENWAVFSPRFPVAGFGGIAGAGAAVFMGAVCLLFSWTRRNGRLVEEGSII